MKKAKVTNMETTSNLPAKAEEVALMPSLEVDMYKMEITAQQIRQYIAPKDATTADIGFFLALSKSLGLNPFANEVYMLPFKGKEGRKYAPVVSYQVMLDRADQSGVWDGMEIDFDDEENPTKCTVTVHRKDWSHPGKRTTLLNEVIRMRWDKETGERVPMALWATNLRQMFEKCSVIAALRFFIPACRRMPYIEAEVMSPNGYVEPQRITAQITAAEAVEPMDINFLRGQYFKYANAVFTDDDARHKWQKENMPEGKESVTSWEAEDFTKPIDYVQGIVFASPSAEEMEAQLGKDAAESDTEADSGAEAAEEGTDATAGDIEIPLETEEPTKEDKLKQIDIMVAETPLAEVSSVSFITWATGKIGKGASSLSNLPEADLDILITELNIRIDADADKHAEKQGELL